MKKSKFADKITDLVEETLVSMNQSDPFTVYDNLDDEFSFTLEHDITHRTMNYDLTELYHIKQEEDIKVKDLYRNHVKSRVEEFVNRSLELANESRYSESGHRIVGFQALEDDFEEDDEFEEEDDYDPVRFDRDDPFCSPEEDDEYDEEENETEDEFDETEADAADFTVNTNEPGVGYVVFSENNDKEELKGVKVSLASEVLPAFLKGDDKWGRCAFVEFPSDMDRSSYMLGHGIYDQVKEKLGGRDSYIAVLDDNHLMCIAGESPEYLKQMLKDMKGSGINIKDDELYYFENGNLSHVFAPDGRQVYSIEEDDDKVL